MSKEYQKELRSLIREQGKKIEAMQKVIDSVEDWTKKSNIPEGLTDSEKKAIVNLRLSYSEYKAKNIKGD
jgi:hypothetical protein